LPSSRSPSGPNFFFEKLSSSYRVGNLTARCVSGYPLPQPLTHPKPTHHVTFSQWPVPQAPQLQTKHMGQDQMPTLGLRPNILLGDPIREASPRAWSTSHSSAIIVLQAATYSGGRPHGPDNGTSVRPPG